MAKTKLIESTDKFIVVLERSNLFVAKQLDAIKKLAETAEDPITIARTLVKKGWLTKWQASQLLSGFSNLTLGKYRLCDHLGKGELGNVYLAENPKLGRKVALKRLSTKHTEEPELVKRFLDEASAAAALDHRNIVHIHDVSSEAQRHYVVMEYVSGRDLQCQVDADGPLSCEEAASVVRQAAEGLGHAHAQGVVHRDIKPANIMVDEDGVVKILDIGVGHLRRANSNPSENTGELMMSAIAYMAPEHARSQAINARCDIYSLGGVLYFLLTARTPFSAKTEAERATIKASKRPIPIVELRPDTPSALIDLCDRMMAPKPDDRLASMADVLAALDGANDHAIAASSSEFNDAIVDIDVAEVEPLEALDTDELEMAAIEDVVIVNESQSEAKSKEEPEPKASAPAISIDLGDAAKPAAAVGPVDFAINTKKRKKKSSAAPTPAAKAVAEKPAAVKASEPVAAAVEPAAAGESPEPASVATKKGLSKGLLIGGTCAAALLLIAGGGLGAMMLLGGGNAEVAQVTPGATAGADDAVKETSEVAETEATEAEPDGSAATEPAADSAAEPSALTEASAAPLAADAVEVQSASATKPVEGSGDVAAVEPVVAAPTTESTEAPADPAMAKTEPPPDAPISEKPTEDKPAEVKPEPAPKPESKPAPAKAPEKKAPPKAKTFVFAPAVDLPIPTADAPELTLGQINIRPEDAVFISLDGGDIAATGRFEFALQNAQSGVAPRDWEFYLSDGTTDPVVIATMSLPEKDLKFKWTPVGVENQIATNLRNCSLKITAGQDQPQDLALRVAQKVPPSIIDVEKPAIVKLPLEGAPDRSSLKLEVTVKGHKCMVEPAQIELSKGGEGVIYFGENQEQAAFAMKLDASINARGIQVKTDPHFIVPGNPPVRLNKGSIKKYEAAQIEQPGLQSKVIEVEKAIKDKKLSPQDKTRGQVLLAEMKQRLELVDKTVEKMTKLSTDMPAIAAGASLQFRVFSDTFEKQIDLIVTDPNAAPVAP